MAWFRVPRMASAGKRQREVLAWMAYARQIASRTAREREVFY